MRTDGGMTYNFFGVHPSQANQAESGWRLKTRSPHQQAFLVNPVPAESVRARGLIRSTEPNAGSLPAGSLSNPGSPRWPAVRVLISRLFSKSTGLQSLNGNHPSAGQPRDVTSLYRAGCLSAGPVGIGILDSLRFEYRLGFQYKDRT